MIVLGGTGTVEFIVETFKEVELASNLKPEKITRRLKFGHDDTKIIRNHTHIYIYTHIKIPI